jgi:RNA polymerase sigma-70 factor, ECF subfamily
MGYSLLLSKHCLPFQGCVFLRHFFASLFRTFETNQHDSLSKEKEEGLSSVTDKGLVLAARKGDHHAFEVLVRRYQDRMMNVAFRMTGDYDDACETVQDTFLAAYKAIGKFRGDSAFSTWLYSICVNHARNRISQRQRRAFRETGISDDGDPENGDATAPTPPDPHSTAIEQLERKALQERVQKCIDGLSQDQREVLVLRDIEGFSYEEIGAMLALPEGTIKSRLFRARDGFRISFKKFLGDY